MRRAAAAGLLAVLVAAALVWVAAASGCGNADPFAGLYWAPSSGRRVEIRKKDGGAYWLYYGARREPYRATRDGDRLVIADPLGGTIVVRPGAAAGTLELEIAGNATLLKPLPEHQ
jgi:hypothetical protein